MFPYKLTLNISKAVKIHNLSYIIDWNFDIVMSIITTNLFSFRFMLFTLWRSIWLQIDGGLKSAAICAHWSAATCLSPCCGMSRHPGFKAYEGWISEAPLLTCPWAAGVWGCLMIAGDNSQSLDICIASKTWSPGIILVYFSHGLFEVKFNFLA